MIAALALLRALSWRWIGFALAVAGLLLWSDHRGYARGAAAIQAEDTKAMARAQADLADATRRIDGINARYSSAAMSQATITREIVRELQPIIQRPVYARPCGDADAVGLLDRAAAAANRGLDPGQPADPAAGAAEGAARQ